MSHVFAKISHGVSKQFQIDMGKLSLLIRKTNRLKKTSKISKSYEISIDAMRNRFVNPTNLFPTLVEMKTNGNVTHTYT